MVNIRLEQAGDEDGIRRVNEEAFGQPDEAALVDALRGSEAVICSLVATEEEVIIGHILFTVAALTSHSDSETLSNSQLEGRSLYPPGSQLDDETDSYRPSQSTSQPPSRPLAALGPVAIAPTHQRQGIGSQLIVAGLDLCRAMGYDLVIVLGHREYYPRFGFRPAAPLGIRWEHGAEAHFMVLELRPGALAGVSGVARYRPEFDGV
jgi:putative acetyltransferase